uniref:protein disulfide-isomerase n=1 Tax=Panthera tigris altaica TaxID=74533 RepID=A0A8C9KCE1_PANTA
EMLLGGNLTPAHSGPRSAKNPPAHRPPVPVSTVSPQGMVDTAKKNFGGGNTAWEEKALSKYEFSEVRLLEIMESLCGSSDFDCHSMLEEHEERLEAWWLRLKKEYPDLFEWFCVKTLEVCCSPGTYGPDCLGMFFSGSLKCPGSLPGRQRDSPCHLHLRADVMVPSSPTRSTSPGCIIAKVVRAGPSRLCRCLPDVDECAAETPPCGDQQYCENVNGSFVWEGECDSTCVGCTGKGPEQCKECVPGYTKESGQCADVDECSLAEKVCTRESENCYNTPGSYVCVCPEGFEETETACVRTQTAADVPEDPTQPPAREDL